eukprot:TRINITY_DN3135_c0_g1_i1.p1 TRINITY_DN3135_c0_g1~~TRINITY_DN3135_c0_g1_i1.p1  ORF type:complete len:223 (-),score=51.75 TRINITY_DN3135_c0_g1_i1:75-743(-)
MDFIKRKTGQQSYGFTIPLITDDQGRKIGKSVSNGHIWLDPKRTSVYDFYQFWFNIADGDLSKMLKAFSFYELSQIDEIVSEHNLRPEKRCGQQQLAREVTKYIHGEGGLKQAELATNIFFGDTDICSLSAQELELAFSNTDRLIKLPRTDVIGQKVTHLAVVSRATPSISQGLKLMKGGGFYINNDRILETERVVAEKDLIDGHALVLRTGKKQFYVIKIE